MQTFKIIENAKYLAVVIAFAAMIAGCDSLKGDKEDKEKKPTQVTGKLGQDPWTSTKAIIIRTNPNDVLVQIIILSGFQVQDTSEPSCLSMQANSDFIAAQVPPYPGTYTNVPTNGVVLSYNTHVGAQTQTRELKNSQIRITTVDKMYVAGEILVNEPGMTMSGPFHADVCQPPNPQQALPRSQKSDNDLAL